MAGAAWQEVKQLGDEGCEGPDSLANVQPLAMGVLELVGQTKAP